MEKGDLVLIDYVGYQDGEIFDLSNEERAKEEGLYNENMEFGPVPVLIGEGYVIEGLEEALEDMEVGDEKELEIPSDKAYGKRSSDNIETYPEKEFKKQDVNARPGDRIMIGNRQGRILSRSSGRVKVDFNHPLSGKDLEYDVEVLEKVEDDEEKARKIFDYRLGHGEIEFDGDKVIIDHDIEDHDHELPENVKEEIRTEILENTGFEEVEIKG
ncbi:FKBP-type peptidyl-prolyl cis-trans isomerase [Candidatus Nanosalina sp. VS9-1]|uniref:FKBP-type peptidyl-prolyl cis-trans isomerase n=1 Tax=Candidatus Nanosalina sp. VS9-1 TaxID=3388566 RepID=UPI0039E140A9